MNWSQKCGQSPFYTIVKKIDACLVCTRNKNIDSFVYVRFIHTDIGPGLYYNQKGRYCAFQNQNVEYIHFTL